MTFDGFPVEMIDFYEGLEADNSKTYWTAHRDVYETAVKAPMEALLAALADEFGPATFFRPYRDVRFSKDKSPYKTAAAAIVSGTAGGNAGLYLQVSADGLLVGGGYHGMASDQVDRYRRAVVDDRHGARLETLLKKLVDHGFEINGEQLKRPPRGYTADSPRLPLLRRKSLHAGRDWPTDEVLHSAAVLDRVASAWRRLAPLNAWLDTSVGPSDQPALGRR